MKDTNKTGTVPEALSKFDDYPDAARIRVKTVAAIAGCSTTTIWRMVRRGTLPEPRRQPGGRITTWTCGEIRKALAA